MRLFKPLVLFVGLIAGVCYLEQSAPAPIESSERILRRPLFPRPRPRPSPSPAPRVPDAPNAPENRDFVGGETYDGRTLKIALPVSEHLRNKAGLDGYGLCTFASLAHAARWQYVPELIDLLDYMTRYDGGGWPDKVDQVIERKAGKDVVQYIQCVRFDEKLLELAVKTGRMPAVTYGYSPRYGEIIAHMVNLVFMDDKYLVFLDNNFPGTYEWVPRAEGIRRIRIRMLDDTGRYAEDGGWFVVLLAPTQPPDLK